MRKAPVFFMLMVIGATFGSPLVRADGQCLALAEAAGEGNTSLMATLIESSVNANCSYNYEEEWEGEIYSGTTTPLHWAAGAGENEAIKLLLRHGANVNTRNSSGGTPLHAASASGRSDAAGILLRNGADVNARDEGGNTPLHRVVWSESPAAVSTLLRHGAEVNAQDNEGNTAADKIMVVEFGSMFDEESDIDAIYEMIDLLKEAGAMPNKRQ
ncbi:MAG: ankyrin repeat domain-containing protein [Alphaproteobacteria bacterium]|nr:ankyrin repeat domain-containing protein [Alphaproteobacteria bacterium]